MLPNYFIAKRLPGAEPPLARAVLDVARILAEWQSTPPLCYTGHPTRRLELSEAGIANYIQWLDSIRASGISKPLQLCSHDWKPALSFSVFYRDKTPAEDIIATEDLWLSLGSKLNEVSTQLDQFMQVVGQLCLSFGAYYAYVKPDSLGYLWVGQKELTNTSSEFRDKPLPKLLLPSQFDSRRVPFCIWWINFWDSLMVETMGLERIKGAPWANIVEIPSRGIVVAVTEEPTDASNPEHRVKLTQIVEHLGLQELQKRYRVAEPIKWLWPF